MVSGGVETLRLTAGADSLVAQHGVVGLGADMWPQYQGDLRQQ
jgi:hypothetical protein